MDTIRDRWVLLGVAVLLAGLSLMAFSLGDIYRGTSMAAFGAALTIYASEQRRWIEVPVWQRLAPGCLVAAGLVMLLLSLGA
jgi:hypothetical protein